MKHKKSDLFIVPVKPGNRAEGTRRREGIDLTDNRYWDTQEDTQMSLESHRENVLTKQNRIAEIAGRNPNQAILSLNRYIDFEWLYVAYKLTRKDGAVGIDGRTAADYEENLKENLENLLNRFKTGSYKAPPVRKVSIPKGDGGTRSLGIPTFEDKVLQRAVLMVLEPVFEQDFHDFSYGFRPGKSAHLCMNHLRDGILKMVGGFVIDLDIKGYFDNIDHGLLREIYRKRIADGVIRRILGKWLKAGVMDKGQLSYSKSGTPQGGVISPLLSNVFLHHILDDWFVKVVKPRMTRSAFMVRYADDAVLVIKDRNDAKKVFEVLPKRFAKFNLALHPDKTKMINFRRSHKGHKLKTFDFLGFTFYWSLSAAKKKIIKWKTSCKSLRKAIIGIHEWCKKFRHLPLKVQHMKLCSKLKGHFAYFGVKFNSNGINAFYIACIRAWHRWLGRRSQKGYIRWDRFNRLLERYPLPKPLIVHAFR